MTSRKVPNLLLKPVLNFILFLYLLFAKLFHVNFEPAKKIDNSYTKFNSFDDPLPLTNSRNLNYQKLITKAKGNGDIIKPVRRQKALTVDIDKCPKCEAPKKYLGSFGHDPEGYQKITV